MATLRLNVDPTGAVSGAQKAEDALQGVAAQAKTTENATTRMGKNLGGSMRSSSMHTANLGAQFNDIGVMLGSGQSPLTLAMQQGTQINQVLDQMRANGQSTGRALYSAFMGVVSPANLLTIGIIAAGAALGQWVIEAFKAGDAADDLSDRLERATDRLAALRLEARELRLGVSPAELALLDKIADLNEQIADAQDRVNRAPARTRQAYQFNLDNLIQQRAEVQGQLDETRQLQTEIERLKGNSADVLTLQQQIRGAVEGTGNAMTVLANVSGQFADNAWSAARALYDAMRARAAGETNFDDPAQPEAATTYRPRVSSEKIAETSSEVTELDDRLVKLQNTFDGVQNSMEDAFMSMSDGTMKAKDAFRSMARDIIAQLYRVLVVQQIVGQFDVGKKEGTGLMGFVGGLFGGGGDTDGARANGGPVRRGESYLVGERGPEVITPAAHGMVAPSGGGSGAVTINQTINVTTGVQATVRAEVMQLMPKIADASKAAVMDARQRGGSFAGAF